MCLPDDKRGFWARRNSAETIICHVEIEGRDKDSLPHRMSEYYVLLRMFQQKLVLSLALVLLPNAGGLSWQSYQEGIFGHQVLHFRYGQVAICQMAINCFWLSL